MQLLGGGFSYGEIPPLDPEADIWGLNRVMFSRFTGDLRWDRWFDLHPTAHIHATRPDAYAWYLRQDGTRPIYRFVDDGPAFSPYPLNALQIGADEWDFTGSLSWMLALAISEDFDAVDLFWFTMHDAEHAQQIPSARYWIGKARGRGMTVTIHGDSALKPSGPLYGLEAV